MNCSPDTNPSTLAAWVTSRCLHLCCYSRQGPESPTRGWSPELSRPLPTDVAWWLTPPLGGWWQLAGLCFLACLALLSGSTVSWRDCGACRPYKHSALGKPLLLVVLFALLFQAFQVSLKSTQGPIDVFLCPEDSSGVCSPVKSPFKATAEESSPGSSEAAASPLLHPTQDVNLPLLPGEQGVYGRRASSPVFRACFAVGEVHCERGGVWQAQH